jgi:hypothetical protein
MNGAHVHLLLNHIPVIGTTMASLTLLYGIWRDQNDVKRIALIIFTVLGLVAIPTYFSGERAEATIENQPDVYEYLIDRHENAALWALISILVTGVVAGAGLFVFRKRKLFPTGLIVSVFILSLATDGLMLWTGNLGGQIRHSEIRYERDRKPLREKED